MSNYYLILVWIVIFAILSMLMKMQRIEYIQGDKVQRYQPLWAIILVAPLVFWAANRGDVIDTGSYVGMFRELPVRISELANYMEDVQKDKGFYFVSALIRIFVTADVKVYFFILAAVQAFFLFKVYRRYSTRYVLSFFLFIASADYVSWMFNGIRQFTAVTITLLAFQYIIDKQYIKAILIILIASVFHQSALLVIPFIFIVQGQAWNKKTLLFMLLAIVAVVYVEQFTGLLDNMLEETQYTNVVSDWQQAEDDGTNILRVLVYAIPAILSLIGLRYIKAKDNRIVNICTNMSIVVVGLYIVSMFTSGIYIGRLPIYFSLYSYILLPWEIDNIFERKSAKIVYVMMILAYLAYYYFQIHLTWGFA